MRTVHLKRLLCLAVAALLLSLSACDTLSFGGTGETGTGVMTGTGTETETQAAVTTEAESETEATTDRPIHDGWLDRENAVFYAEDGWEIVVITEMGDGYLIAQTIGGTVWQVKLNGTPDDRWGVGDETNVHYKNAYKDELAHRMECDLIDMHDLPVPEKPVIYLYPERTTDVSVKLTVDGELTCTYPVYRDGWQVTAIPDGTLTDADGMTYNYLYWEGVSHTAWDLSRGFCVRGADTAAFLEDALEKLGLTRREANEFIVYWLPRMEGNAYNVIAFQTDAYTESAKLDISPAPDTLIRVFMAYRASDTYVEMEPQELAAPARTGFTVVEWGGAEGNGETQGRCP